MTARVKFVITKIVQTIGSKETLTSVYACHMDPKSDASFVLQFVEDAALANLEIGAEYYVDFTKA
jgi:hypothetical protein